VGILITIMHQNPDSYKTFSTGDMVELDNGMPVMEAEIGLGVVLATYPEENLEENQVLVHWQRNVWQNGRRQVMDLWEIRHAILE